MSFRKFTAKILNLTRVLYKLGVIDLPLHNSIFSGANIGHLHEIYKDLLNHPIGGSKSQEIMYNTPYRGYLMPDRNYDARIRMKKELDEALCRDFPEIFRDRHGSTQHTPMAWGFSCDSGWEPLIRELCENLMLTAQIEGLEIPVAAQVKEKFGTLCFYVDSAHSIQRAIISQAEQQSACTCERCGKHGRTRGGGWRKTLCTEHAVELGYELEPWEKPDPAEV